MRRQVQVLVVLVSVLCLLAASGAARAEEAKTYGKGVGAGETIRIGDIIAAPDKYVGKTVRVTGKITDVCPRMGCWIDIREEASGTTIRFKVDDGVIVFPVADKGKDVVAEGVVQKIELTQEQAIAHGRHEAEETGKAFDPASVTGPAVQYRIQGTGAVVR